MWFRLMFGWVNINYNFFRLWSAILEPYLEAVDAPQQGVFISFVAQGWICHETNLNWVVHGSFARAGLGAIDLKISFGKM